MDSSTLAFAIVDKILQDFSGYAKNIPYIRDFSYDFLCFYGHFFDNFDISQYTYYMLQRFLTKQIYIPKKRLLALAVCFFLSFGTDLVSIGATANSTVDYLFSLNNIEVIPSDNVSYEYPTWAKMDPEMQKTSLAYWVKKVLPYSQDRNKSAYLVYPKAGIVVPVLNPSQTDATLIKQWKAFNHYPYLENGALHYFGIWPSAWAGNMSIAAHSSYVKQDTGRYKTVFQALVITNPGDTVWYFEKNSKWTFDRYEYEVLQSYETDKNNVSILWYDGDGKSYLTTYWCYPIWSNAKRWVNKAVLKDITLEHSSLDESINSTSEWLGLPVDLEFHPDITPTPKQLIGLNALDAIVAKNTPKNTLTAGSSPQDVASQIAAAMKDAKEVAMLWVAPIQKPSTWSITTVDTKAALRQKIIAANKLKGEQAAIANIDKTPTKEPNQTISIDITDTSKLMRNIIVSTTKFTAWDVVQMPTMVNPILATNACYTPKENTIISLGQKTKARDQVVFQWLMNAYGLTSYSDTDSYNPDSWLKRNEAAKILVNFAKNVLCRQPKDTYQEWMYNDIAGTDSTLLPYIKEAYEYGIMKWGKWKFRPLDRISKQEFIAGMMRILLNSYLAEGNNADWYKNYETVFADYGLKTLVLTDKTINRYDMSKLFYKVYYSDAYQLTDAGYVLPNTVQ